MKSLNLRWKRFLDGNVVSKNGAKVHIILVTSKLFTKKYQVFAHLLVPLALPKVLSFGKPQNNLGFRSLISTFAPKYAIRWK